MSVKLDKARNVALESVDRAESKVKQAILGAALIEKVLASQRWLQSWRLLQEL